MLFLCAAIKHSFVYVGVWCAHNVKGVMHNNLQVVSERIIDTPLSLSPSLFTIN